MNLVVSLIDWLVESGHGSLAGRLAAAGALVVERHWVRVVFDGEDWIHTWTSGVLVTALPQTRPERQIRKHMRLFTTGYCPESGDVVLDIGAGIGTEAQGFSRLVGSAGRVICVEANPVACRRLNKLVARAGLENVEVYHLAVGDVEGEVDIVEAGPDGLASRVHAQASAEMGERVRMTRLDTLLDDLGIARVDLLKLNVEGAEVHALNGCGEAARRVRHWVISCHDFLGDEETRSYARVVNWLRTGGWVVSSPSPVAGEPWVEFYVYARRRRP